MARHTLSLCAVLVLISCLPAMAQGGITIVATSGNSIETVDVASGSALTSHPITVPGKTVFGTYGVARDPQSGTIYAVVNYQEVGGRSLITVDPATGSGIHVGTTAIVSDIAFAADGTLYAVGGNAGAFANQLVTLNKQTGVATSVATLTSGSGHALAFNAEDGLLYHITKPDFFTSLLVETIDPQAFAVPPVEVMTADTYLEPTGFTHLRGASFLIGGGGADQWLLDVERQTLSSLAPAEQWKSGLTTIPAGSTCPPQAALYGTGPFEGPQFLHTIDPATGVTTLIGPIAGVTNITGIDFAPDGVLYALGHDSNSRQTLFTLDPCTGEATTVGIIWDSPLLRSLSITPDGTTFSYASQTLTFVNRTEPGTGPIGDTNIFADNFGFAYSEADNQAYFATVFNAIGTIDAINLENALSTSHAELTLPANITSLRSMDFNSGDQKLYAIVSEGGLGSTTSLATVDPVAQSVTLVGQTSSAIEQIAFRSGTPASIYILNVFVDGAGTGSVISAPAGIDCPTGACQWYFDAGATVTLTASTAAGSRFDGWSGACSGTGTCVMTMNAMRTVHARFTQLFNVHLAYAANNNGHGAVEVYSLSDGRTASCDLDAGPCDLAVAGGIIQLHALSAMGSSFLSWTPNCAEGVNNTEYCTLTLDAAKSATASFDMPLPQMMTVTKTGNGTGTVTSSPAGINCGVTCTASFANSSMVTLTATPAAGTTFTGWSGDCTGTGNCQVTMSAARNVTATFTVIQYTLTVKYAGSGSGSVVTDDLDFCAAPQCTFTLNAGSSIGLFASAANGSAFAGYSGACTGTQNSCLVTLTADKTVTVTFTLLPTLQFGTPPPPATVNSGQSAQFTLGFQVSSSSAANLVLTCSGLPNGAACNFNPNNIAVPPNQAVSLNSQLSVSTTPHTVAALERTSPWQVAWAIGFIGLCGIGKRTRRPALWLMALASLLILPSCGGGGHKIVTTMTSSSGTPAGTYTITINAVVGVTAKTTTVTMTVQ